MKKYTFLLIISVGFFFGCRSTKPAADTKTHVSPAAETSKESTPQAINFSDESTFLLGNFKLPRLAMEPYSEWYLKGYDEYQINSEAINNLLDIKKDNLKIKIIMGTWCPDSRREVPRFIKVLDICRMPIAQVIFIGVDRTKKADVEEYESMKIEKVPTFIIYKNNIEAGRIIEIPVTSLEQDLVNILTRNE